MVELKLLALATVVFAAATATAACGGAPADRDQASAVAFAGRDTDRDGLSDGAEVRRYHTNPRKRDTDGDGLSDGAEVHRHHTNPRKRDTDGDSFGDGVELRRGTNPRNSRSRPGFPGEDTTGVSRGTALSAYTGPSTISTPNREIVGKTMGCIRVEAPGVVIRSSRISCGDGGVAVASYDGHYAGTPLLLEDTEIDCQNTGGTAIGDANVTARQLNIHGCENGFDINQNITVEDSYIHDMYNSAEAHTDGIQFASHFENGQLVPGALNVTIRHNTIYGMGADGSFGTSAIITNHPGTDHNVLIENNLLAGGAYTLYCNSPGAGANYRVVNNHFSRKFKSMVGYYGPSEDCADETQSGNVYHETGQPLRLR
jgi:hypothetical protein